MFAYNQFNIAELNQCQGIFIAMRATSNIPVIELTDNGGHAYIRRFQLANSTSMIDRAGVSIATIGAHWITHDRSPREQIGRMQGFQSICGEAANEQKHPIPN